jgi:aminoglycoside 3-N-acetyltransferase
MNFKKEIFNKFNHLEISKAKCLFVANDMAKIGIPENESKKSMLTSIYEAIIEINPKITIVVPTSTLNLVGTENVFDIDNTPSFRMGAFSEYIRKIKNSKRGFNALWSLSAIGPLADEITQNVSNHAYDKNSSFAKIFKIDDAFFLGLGNHPRYMLSIIHHFETIFNVPYRFTKGFEINCVNKLKVFKDIFYLEVLKENVRYNKRSLNKKIFDNFESKESINKIDLGNSHMYLFNLKNFYEITCELFKQDVNCWWK